MKKGRKYSKEEITIIAKSAIGKTFREIKDAELVSVSDKALKKGGLGQLVETALYGIENNNDSEPDFMPAGVELKVTPYKNNKNKTLSAKERLVLNVIDFDTEYANDFKSSHFWFKNNQIQIIWYLYDKNKEKLDYVITHEKLLELALSEDLVQIEHDWNFIVEKIKQGKAHEISEADTMYLGACTKGIKGENLRHQPFSDILAKQRAFCFKHSYMTSLVRKYIGNFDSVEKILKNSGDFEDFINSVIVKYKEKTKSELMKELNVSSDAKNLFSMLISRMFNVKSNLRNTDEFLKANIIPKTVRVEENGTIEQSMSFPAFKFDDVMNIDFDDSDLKEMFETTKFMFFIFKKQNNDYVFKGIKLWNMPEELIETVVRDMYDKTKEIIKNGNIVNHIDERGRRITNFLGASYNGICHVRPHSLNRDEVVKLPVPDKLTGLEMYTKQCFWINNTYLREILKDFID